MRLSGFCTSSAGDRFDAMAEAARGLIHNSIRSSAIVEPGGERGIVLLGERLLALDECDEGNESDDEVERLFMPRLMS